MTTASNYAEWISATERQIIDCLIDTIIGAGHMIDVSDWLADFEPVEKMRDKAAIQAEVGATGETKMDVYSGDRRVGFIILIHGNETDVISDHSDNDFMAAMVRPASDLADKLSEEN